MGMIIAALLIYPTILPFKYDDLVYHYGEKTIYGQPIKYYYEDLRGNFYRLCPMKGVIHYEGPMDLKIRCTNHNNTMPILLIEFFCTFLLVTMLLNIKYINGVG